MNLEIASNATLNEVCSVIYNCPNICNTLNLSDGVINYPAWPNLCLAQDPCPDVPWKFDPAQHHVFGVMLPPQGCPFVAFYETKFCDSDTLFRIKFIQMACTNNIPTQFILTKAVRRVLKEEPPNQNGPFERYLLSYSCWDNIDGYYPQRIAPCLDVDECCYIRYRVDGLRSFRQLSQKDLLSSGGQPCSNNCTYVCDDLVSDQLMPLGLLPDRWAKISLPEDTKQMYPGTIPYAITAKVVQNYLQIKFDNPTSENMQISIFNILGEKVYDGTISSSNRIEFKVDLTNYTRGLYSFVLRLNDQTFFGTFLKY